MRRSTASSGDDLSAMEENPVEIATHGYAQIAIFLSSFAHYEAAVYRVYASYLRLNDPVVRALVSDSRWNDALDTLKRVMKAKNATDHATNVLNEIRSYEKQLRSIRDICAHYPAQILPGKRPDDAKVQFIGEINPNNKNPEPWEELSFSDIYTCNGAANLLMNVVLHRLEPALLRPFEREDALMPKRDSWPRLPVLCRSNR